MPYKWGQGGGPGGNEFDDASYTANSPSNADIMSLQVNHGDTLDHLAVLYFQPGNPRGDEFWIQHGSSNGGNALPPYTIDLSPRGGPRGERLVRVEMWCADYNGTYQLNGLRFTKATGPQDHQPPSPVYGSAVGDYVNLNAQPDGAICWFYGRDGLFVNALGIYVRSWAEEP
jgi:hypothetical protein